MIGGPGMPRRDLRLWAKEEIMDAIDAMIRDKGESADRLDFDEEEMLREQRNRVARLLGRPQHGPRAAEESAPAGKPSARSCAVCGRTGSVWAMAHGYYHVRCFNRVKSSLPMGRDRP